MEALRTSMLPRRLTQMYTDTKRSFEQIIQTDIADPRLSSLNVKLRIQKDRFIAWGLDWEDSNGGYSDDIDGSLDRAGLSDLAASIMSTTQSLIDEADRIQPPPRSQNPQRYPVEKMGIVLNSDPSWSTTNPARLEDILRDITMSIDTLCDLSRSRQILPKIPESGQQKTDFHSSDIMKNPPNAPSSASKGMNAKDRPLMRRQSSLTSSTRIDPHDLIYRTNSHQPTATPPSYDTTATDPGNRIFAFLKTSPSSEKTSNLTDSPNGTPVLIDYYSEDGTSPRYGVLPSLQRFEDLVLSLQGHAQEPEYTGSLRILGWFADSQERQVGRYAFVYQIPEPSVSKMSSSLAAANAPRSLLSYLQHHGVTDSSNVPSLEDRFRLALNLVTSLLHVHAKGLTHRNINSNNIVFTDVTVAQGVESKPWKEGAIRKPFLVSWDQCSEDTSTLEPETLISNIYRPPGIERGQRSQYRPAHDIYSMGLVLLEIGLWMPLNKLWKTKYARSDFKARLQAIYAKKLAAKCGTSYMQVVEFCLQAVDEGHTTHASQRPTSRDGQINAPTDYYWNVVKPLERCCVMDISDEPKVVPVASATPRHPAAETKSSQKERSGSPPTSVKEAPQVPEGGGRESNEWMPKKGFSPNYPKGINLPVWDYVINDDFEEHFNAVMVPKISWMAAKAIPVSESWELDVCMAGASRESAKPSLFMTCKSKRLPTAWKILEYVNKEKSMFDIYVSPGQLRRSKAKKKSKGKKCKKTNAGEDKPGQYPSSYQQRPACGASIGCFVDEQHSEAVTFGGIVLVDGEPHGMSVHHMLEDSDLGDDSMEESRLDEGTDFAVSFDDIPDDTFDPISAFESLPEGFDALEIWKAESEHEDDASQSQQLGTTPGLGEAIIVTQPALDDVDPGYFPSEDEMSDDHLVIHGLGTIHASSGLRRAKFEDISHEIDWALFTFHDDRKPTSNTIDGGVKHIIKADALGDLKVHAFGSTSGLESGRIRPKMDLACMPGRLSPSPVWKFEGKFGVGGDSGAWIIDKNGGLCGHVSSFSESQQYGVLAPMEAQLHDMEQTLHANVALPVSEKCRPQSFREQIMSRKDTISRTSSHNNEPDSPPESPELATSPQVSSPQGPEPRSATTLSLNDVAEKWECSQASKRKSVELRSPKDGRSRAGTMHLRDGALRASC
ncbi:hypothetical protein ACLMJK_004751 [Lecanora helva]